MAKARDGISVEEAIERIKSMYNSANVAGMARYGINAKKHIRSFYFYLKKDGERDR
jgi:hypothetical protein